MCNLIRYMCIMEKIKIASDTIETCCKFLCIERNINKGLEWITVRESYLLLQVQTYFFM